MKRILLFALAALSVFGDPPASNVVIDRTNSITANLKFLALPGATTNKNIVNGDAGTLLGANPGTWSGPGCDGGTGTGFSSPSGDSGAYWPLPTTISGSLSHNWTILVRANVTSWSDWSPLVGIPNNPTASNPLFAIGIMRNGGTDSAANFLADNFNNQQFHTSDSGYFSTGACHTYALVKAGSVLTWYKDGAAFGSPIDMGNDFALGFGTKEAIVLFNSSIHPGVSGNSPLAYADVYGIWDRALSATHIASVTSNPYQLVVVPAPTYTISGTVGASGANAKVVLSGASTQTVIANGSGNYSFVPVIAGSYTVTPRKLGYTFGSPASVTVSNANQTANFTATAIPFGPAKMVKQAITSTSAGVLITGTGGNPCTLNLLEGTDITGKPHPDAIDSVATSRPDTKRTDDGILVRLGHDVGNNAMSEGTPYFAHTDCGAAGQATLAFITPHPSTGTSPAPPVPFDSTRPYNYGGPNWDLTKAGEQIALPYSGIRADIALGPYVRRWETWNNEEGLGYIAAFGGTGWTIPAGSFDDSRAPGSVVATVTASSTPALLIPGNQSALRHNATGLSFEALGLQVWGGGGNGSTDADRSIRACITTHMVARTCDTNSDPKYSANPYVEVVLPEGSSTSVANPDSTAASLSTRGTTPWPTQYPAPGFLGWNTWIPNERQPIGVRPNGEDRGIHIQSIDNGIVTATNTWGDEDYIPEGLKGNYLYIPGVAATECPGDFCAVNDVLPNGQVQLAATITRGSFSNAVAYQYGILLWKATTTGAVSIASRYTAAGRIGQMDSTATIASCSTVPKFMNGDKGSHCLLTISNHPKSVTWFPDSHDKAPIYRTSLSWNQGLSFPNIPNANDRPNGEHVEDNAFWDRTNPNRFYFFQQNNGGTFSIFRGELDANPDGIDTGVTVYSQAFNGDSATSWSTGHVLWTNLTPASATPAMDVFSQINRAHPSYAQYPDYTSGGWSWVGMSGDIGWLKNDGGAQDAKACLIAAFNLTTTPATLIRFFSTMSDALMLAEANGGIAGARWGACHFVGADPDFPNAVVISNNAPGNKGFTGGILGTAALFQPYSIMRQNGTWSADGQTALQWPPPAAGGSSSTLYKSDYSGTLSSLPQKIQDYVYAPNQFVRMRIRGAGNLADNYVCNASTDMGSLGYPVCGWDSGKHALPATWKPIVGDVFSWAADGNFCSDGDHNTCEQFVIAQINEVTSAYADIWAVRSASRFWQCLAPSEVQIDGTFGPAVGPLCVNSASQNTLPNGWRGQMVPATTGQEYIKRIALDPATGNVVTVAFQNGIFAGHSTSGVSRDGKTSLIGYFNAVKFNSITDMARPWYVGDAQHPGLPSTVQGVRPTFAGMGNQGFSQSYLSAGGFMAGSVYRGSAIDQNHFANGGGGMDFKPGDSPDKSRTIVPVSGMPDVYRYVHPDFTGGAGTYKIAPIYLFAGTHIYKDRSGPACNMASAPAYTLCFNYRTGITSGVAGSSVGDLFFKGPYIIYSGTTTFLNTAAAFPTATFLGPAEGGIRQWDWERNDPTARWHRFIGYTGPPGFTQGYSEPTVSPFGNRILTHGANWINGIAVATLELHLPEQSTYKADLSAINFASFNNGGTWISNFDVKVAPRAGATHARVRFGLNPNYECTEAGEACVTDEAHTAYNDPYAFISQASSPTACASGCTIHPPFFANRLYWYTVDYMAGGSVVYSKPARFGTAK